jgi:hypothetical protein
MLLGPVAVAIGAIFNMLHDHRRKTEIYKRI